ncbi:acyl-ACP--UDP-N-acetylglucosamine O-acyltransferase [Celerinatantimonas diazotrophica]|uniref:Acyl-[acyl-carrier-protein]--UDP-N-acetylglucosamine O-acyltransferase n=1 Tax=Celerinatantimonas diazotrophica TaxID=412034 RepID=A0A4R1J9K5_9GAMM|nr:acyl-ACP--UDP-N-acetylglucosamine O-acyltransferase [Celerinatantimonas diazotrophica]TCK47295.1 acyl-[acyl-carrier-protein]--UDP-N-acetylglucosamine O-acyltransferase [Celerinatantimonas diazotrophica]CAG9296068.1 Acyl-[acyl-carrier-protein]--UDP-N-acetylglucosamine O-acyltransferase [Celerinatantimonas diazotrophica]
MIDSTAMIHPTALIGSDVTVKSGVQIGAYSVVEGDVTIGENSWIGSHVVIKGRTTIGRNNRIYQFASIGEACQDLKYRGEDTELVIGDDNTIRESVTMHRGTIQDNALTKVGSHNLFMINAHVAHDCIIGDNCIFANNATLAGHVTIGDYVIFGGLAAIHQFGKVGAHAFIGGCAALNRDVPPYVMAVGNYARPVTINSEGLRRRGFSNEAIRALRRAYKILYREGYTVEQAIEQMQTMSDEFPEVKLFVDFLSNHGRGIIR